MQKIPPKPCRTRVLRVLLWQSRVENDPEFILFENAFACYNTTVEVLKRALTNSSQYNQIKFRDSITLIDIAKLNGYHTHWYSNQNKLSDGAEVTMMGRTAQDFFFFRDETKALENSYDRKLLDLLKEKEEDLSHGKHFIVLHLMGSHFDYRNDYTNEYNKFGEDTKEAMYANSILYTDALLREIYEYGKDHLNMKLMLYFSDHGENMQFTHHPNKKYLDTIEIPMLIYASKDFMKSDDNFKQRINILSQRKDFYFTNDMLYNLMIGLLGWNTTENRWYDPKEDLSSNQYRYSTRKDITSMEMPIDDFLSYK